MKWVAEKARISAATMAELTADQRVADSDQTRDAWTAVAMAGSTVESSVAMTVESTVERMAGLMAGPKAGQWVATRADLSAARSVESKVVR